MSGEEAVSFGVSAKSITTNLVISKGELYEYNQSRPPLECSIIFLSMLCASSSFIDIEDAKYTEADIESLKDCVKNWITS